MGSVGERTTKGGTTELAIDFSLTALSLSASNGFFSSDLVGSLAREAQSHLRVSTPPRVSTAAHIACQTSTITRTKCMRRATLPGGCDVAFERSDGRRVDGRRGAGFNGGAGGGATAAFARVAMSAGEDSVLRGGGGATRDLRDQADFMRAWPPSPLLDPGNGGGNSLLAGLAIVLGIPFPVWLWFYGEKLRQRNPEHCLLSSSMVPRACSPYVSPDILQQYTGSNNNVCCAYPYAL